MPIIAGQSCFRDKLEDDVLDISLMQLAEVPVDELALLPKGTTLDMSNNLLVRLPENFPTLMHLIKLDLSKNQLAELPEYFGQLKNLRHLDLYSNQLARLPLSFAQLTRLKWLDLKNNPLVAALQQAAGPCITAEECQQCAKKVVNLMQNMQIQMEKERQRIAMEQRQEEERRGLLEEKERQKIRAEKKAAKERRKQLTKVKAEEAQNSGPYETPGVVPDPSHGILQHDGHFSSGAVGSTTKHKVARQDGFCRSLLTLVFMAFMVVAGAGISMIWIYTGGRLDQPSIERAIPVMWRDIDAWTTNANQKMFVLIRELQAQIQPIWDSLMEKFRWLVEELDRLSGVLVQKLDENLSPTIFSFKEYLWKQLRHVKAHLSEAWTFARPSVLGLRDKMFEYFEILKHNSEFYLPKVFDFVWECCSRCISWVQSTVSDLYE